MTETRILRRSAPAACLLLALACSSGGAPGGSDQPGGSGTITAPATAAEYCDAYHALLAKHYAACHHGSTAWGEHLLDPTLLCTDPVKAVVAGRAAYDQASASTCLSFLDRAECVTLDGLFDGTVYEASCGRAIRGTVADGGTCYTDSDCASSRCANATACPGTCASTRTGSQPCQVRRDCAPGSFCVMNTTLGYFTCAPISYPGLGASCSAGGMPCQAGLYCDLSASPSVCKALKTTGPCTSTDECAPGLRCDGGSCTAIPGPGDPCAQKLDACGPGLYCGATGACVDDVAVGQACPIVAGYYSGCIGDRCDPAGVCLQQNIAPTYCSTDLACAPRWVCRTGCVPPPCAEP
jgi:hypothetical protein